ncbi:MAG: nucleotide exchange factor GrpE [Firmicutes bacterium]|nr:nucleotide exchange factor GrpE [Bacillota bacterium]
MEKNKGKNGTDQKLEELTEESTATRDEAAGTVACGQGETGEQEKAKEAPAPEAASPEAPDTTQALHKKVEELEREKEEYLQSYLRLRADFENYKRRTRQEIQQAADAGKEELLTQLLPVLDNLELALASTGEPEKWRSGVEMIFRQFLGVLAETGLRPIPAVGESFDPKHHEALMREASSQPENTILEEIKKGYFFKEKTLRPSLVKVSAFDPDLAGEKEKE